MANKRKPKILIALSGGIDSAVSAHLLIKQGYEVEAAFMKNWSSTAGLKYNECPWLVDRQDALRVAAFLRIPLYTLDFERQYQQKVMKYFFDEYKKGRTPNPDVMCNKEIKFKLLYNWAMKNGFDYLATGHYARIGLRAKGIGLRGGKRDLALSAIPYTLNRSNDEFKDQTYFIYNIKTEQLPHLFFPIGGMKKTAVRSLARKIGLPNAEKKESMGLCFVGRIRLKDFLEQKLKAKPGPIVLASLGLRAKGIGLKGGKRDLALSAKPLALVVGQHQGLHNYTIGQRQGIKVGGNAGPYYVVKKDLKKNILYVTNNSDDNRLLAKEVEIHSVNWLVSPPFEGGVPRAAGGGGWTKSGKYPTTPSASQPPLLKKEGSVPQFLGRYRHQGDLAPLTLLRVGKGRYRVQFKHPQKAVASGQSLVLYKGKECVGGGVIV